MATEPTIPTSGDENVEIRLTSDGKNTLMLHSYVLALHSPWFKASLSERWNGAKSTANASADKIRWVYELRFDKGTSTGLLARATEPLEGSVAATEIVPTTLPDDADEAADELHEARLPRVEAHRQMFGALYHIAPSFTRYSIYCVEAEEILELAEVARTYGCQDVVNLHLEKYLLTNREDYLSTCIDEPFRMLKLAQAVGVGWLFREASIHIIGQCWSEFNTLVSSLREIGLLDLLRNKLKELQKRLAVCERKMLLLQPSNKGERHDYAAVDFLRQWLTNALTEARCNGSNLGRNYAHVYRRVQELAESTQEELSNFGALQEHMTRQYDDNFYIHPCTRAAVLEVFKRAAVILTPILSDVTVMQSKSSRLNRDLTCTAIDDDELPWATGE